MMTLDNRSWKDAIMDGALAFTEVMVSVIKAISIVGGIIGANLADIGFGTLALTFMFGGSGVMIANMTPSNLLSLFVSAGTSAIQIGLWGVLARKGISLKQLWSFRRLPADIQMFLVGAIFVWGLDTTLDISPLSILIKGSLYEGGSWFSLVKIVVYSLVFLLCGFSEPLTANMRQMLESGNKPSANATNTNKGNANNTQQQNRYVNNSQQNQNRTGSGQRNNSSQNQNKSSNVNEYLQNKARAKPLATPTYTTPSPQGKRNEPTYHPIGMKENVVGEVDSFDDDGVGEYMEMLEKMQGKNNG